MVFIGNNGVSDWDILGLAEWSDWTDLLSSGGGWRHVGGGGSRVAREGGTTLEVVGGDFWGAAVYIDSNGPPIEMDCQTAELEFTYHFVKGSNSGLHFSIRTIDYAPKGTKHLQIGGYELQLGTPELSHIGRLNTLQDSLMQNEHAKGVRQIMTKKFDMRNFRRKIGRCAAGAAALSRVADLKNLDFITKSLIHHNSTTPQPHNSTTSQPQLNHGWETIYCALDRLGREAGDLSLRVAGG
jgi:hypothetical protein